MPHINLPPGHSPGISGLLIYRPETAGPLRELVEVLLRGPNSLTPGEREIIAASVSWWNECHFCHTSHAAAACAHLDKPVGFIDDIKAGLPNEALSEKMRALLQVAHQVQRGGKQVTEADIAAARAAGATDVEIHDTVLIAAAFCMFNRYVDGLQTSYTLDDADYTEMGRMMAQEGYLEGKDAAGA